jgi:hypothetical protein
VRDAYGQTSSVNKAIRTDGDDEAAVPVLGLNVNGSDAVSFRCAASTKILETRHFLAGAPRSTPEFRGRYAHHE